jgi:hypothetical protein
MNTHEQIDHMERGGGTIVHINIATAASSGQAKRGLGL